MSSKLVRIDVHLADNVAASAFLHNALLEEFNPFLLSGRRVLRTASTINESHFV